MKFSCMQFLVYFESRVLLSFSLSSILQLSRKKKKLRLFIFTFFDIFMSMFLQFTQAWIHLKLKLSLRKFFVMFNPLIRGGNNLNQRSSAKRQNRRRDYLQSGVWQNCEKVPLSSTNFTLSILEYFVLY